MKTLQNIARYYIKTYKVSSGTRGSVKFDSTSKSLTAFQKLFVTNQDIIRQHCGRTSYSDLFDAMDAKYGLRDDKDIISKIGEVVYGSLVNKVNKEHIEKAVKGLNNIDGFASFDYTEIIPILDVETSQKVLFNEKSLQVVHSATYEAYDDWLKKQDNKIKELLNMDLKPALVRYIPSESGGTSTEEVDGQMVTCVNSHNKPEWRKKELKDPKLPPIFKDLMKHLFPEQECRKYMYFWMHNMLVDRNSMHLLLHGARGIGKNSLVEIMAALVGQSNYYAVPKEFWGNNFNSELRHRRLLYFDEHKINNKENLSQFKIYSDSRMAYHGKHMSIRGLETNHASHVIANNLEEVNHLVQESRRFSVPILTHDNISDSWGEEKVEKLWSLRTDEDYLGNIGWWVIKNAPLEDFHKDRPYKTSLFYEIVTKALYPWKAWILEIIESREADSIKISDFQKDELSYRGNPIGRIKIETFLASHKDSDGEYYGYVKQVEGERYIIPSDKYLERKEEASPVVTDEEFSDMEF